MTIKILLFIILATMSVQADRITSPQGDAMLPAERSKLEKEKKIDKRIKIYNAAITRLHKAFDAAASAKDFESVPPLLRSWSSILEESLKDIDANVSRKKKSGALIDYEIHLRKSINEINDYRVQAPLEQQGYLETWLTQAEQIQSKFLDIIFLGK